MAVGGLGELSRQISEILHRRLDEDPVFRQEWDDLWAPFWQALQAERAWPYLLTASEPGDAP